MEMPCICKLQCEMSWKSLPFSILDFKKACPIANILSLVNLYNILDLKWQKEVWDGDKSVHVDFPDHAVFGAWILVFDLLKWMLFYTD